MISAESPTRLNVMDWPEDASCTNFAFGPAVCAVAGLPASVAGQLNDVSPVLAAPMKPLPPPLTPCVGQRARSMPATRSSQRFRKPVDGGPVACTPSVIESPRHTTLHRADKRFDSAANYGVSA